MNELFGLTQTVIDKINSVFEKYPQIQKVMIYGSRAKGNYRPGSDIDLTMWGDDISLEFIWKIENEIDDLLLPYMMDLSAFESVQNLELKDHIQRVGKVFYKKK